MLKEARPKAPSSKISFISLDEIYSVDCSPSWAFLGRSSNEITQPRLTWFENPPQVDLSEENQFSEEKGKRIRFYYNFTLDPIFAFQKHFNSLTPFISTTDLPNATGS